MAPSCFATVTRLTFGFGDAKAREARTNGRRSPSGTVSTNDRELFTITRTGLLSIVSFTLFRSDMYFFELHSADTAQSSLVGGGLQATG